MANRTHFLQYYIHLTDKAAYDAGQAQADLGGGWIVDQAPDDVAATYGATIVIPSPLQRFDPPCLTSGYFAENFNYPRNVGRFTRKSGGWFGLPFLFGDTHTYRWSGQFNYAGTDENETEIPSEPSPVAMVQRRWVDGFENGNGGASAIGGNGNDRCIPSASRHIGGYGWAARNGQSYNYQHNLTEAGGAADNKGWDRIYVRLLAAPNSSQTFWEMIGATSPNAGVRLRFGVGGTIEIVNSDPVSTLTGLGATSALTVGEWVKLDILYRTGAAPDSFFKLYINGVTAFSVTGGSLPAGTGLTQVQNVTGTRIRDGNSLGHNGSWNFDDWIGMQLPTGGSNPNLFPARDWNSGSKVVPLIGKAAAASNTGNWAGPGGAAPTTDWRFAGQRPVSSVSTQVLTTATGSQRLAVVTDADRRIDLDPGNRGIAAMSVGCFSLRNAAAGTDAAVGMKLPTAAEVTGALTTNEATIAFTQGGGRLLYSANSIEPYSPCDGLEIAFIGSSHASAKSLANVIGQAECIGIFHPEDYVPQADDPAGMTRPGIEHVTNPTHHLRYHDGPWAVPGQGVPSITVVHARTYVGTGTSIQLAFRVPPTWLFIRNTSTHAYTWWMASAPAAFHNGDISLRSSLITRAFIDPNFAPAAEDDQAQQTIIEICGNDANINASGTTYECIAFCDPGGRFGEAGALAEETGSANTRVLSLNNPELVPEFLTMFRTQVGNTTTKGLLVKGLGAPTAGIYRCNSTSLTGVTVTAGSVSVASGSTVYQNAQLQYSLVAHQRDDGSGDPNVNKVLQIATWTGDGSASRTVTLAPASGRRPMWALCMGSNGATRVRDASHTSTNSLNVASNAQVTDGFTAGGIDQVSVGSALNASGVIYELLVFPSCDATAGNNGWGIDCENTPVEPWTPPGKKLPPEEPEEPPENPNPCGTPGLVPTGTITQCAGPSTLVINAALSQLGVTKQLVAATLNTEVSQEATVCRLHFDEDVRKCLRDFPWPFATRYLKLTAIGGPAERQDLVQAYSSTTAYTAGMVVLSGGTLYYALQASTGQAVTNPTYWTTEPPEEFNGDWVYAYLLPSDFVFARRLVDPDKRRRAWDLEPPPFRVGSWGNNPILYANEENVELEYTHISGCVAYQGDALFRSALSWRHAHSIAPGLSRDAKLTGYAWEMYQRLLRDARASGAQEQQQEREGDVDWIQGRN